MAEAAHRSRLRPSCAGPRALACACLLAAGAALAAPPPLAERWQRFVDHSRFEVVIQAYDVLDGLDPQAPPDAVACSERAQGKAPFLLLAACPARTALRDHPRPP